MHQASPSVKGLDRRRFLVGTAAAGAGVATGLTWPKAAEAATEVVTAPEPIVSVLDPGLPIHLQLPGPPGLTLLYSQTPVGLFGLNVERTSVGNFKGNVAWGYMLGTATGSDGTEYGLELDTRVSQGEYKAADGQVRTGLFAMI